MDPSLNADNWCYTLLKTPCNHFLFSFYAIISSLNYVAIKNILRGLQVIGKMAWTWLTYICCVNFRKMFLSILLQGICSTILHKPHLTTLILSTYLIKILRIIMVRLLYCSFSILLRDSAAEKCPYMLFYYTSFILQLLIYLRRQMHRVTCVTILNTNCKAWSLRATKAVVTLQSVIFLFNYVLVSNVTLGGEQ